MALQLFFCHNSKQAVHQATVPDVCFRGLDQPLAGDQSKRYAAALPTSSPSKVSNGVLRSGRSHQACLQWMSNSMVAHAAAPTHSRKARANHGQRDTPNMGTSPCKVSVYQLIAKPLGCHCHCRQDSFGEIRPAAIISALSHCHVRFQGHSMAPN